MCVEHTQWFLNSKIRLTESELNVKLVDVRRFGDETDKPSEVIFGGGFSIGKNRKINFFHIYSKSYDNNKYNPTISYGIICDLLIKVAALSSGF